MKKVMVLGATLVLVLGVAGYALSQSAAPQGGMMGPGGHGGMGSGMMMNMMSGQPLTQEQIEQFAKQHGITVEQAKQMTDTCAQVMANAKSKQPQAQ